MLAQISNHNWRVCPSKLMPIQLNPINSNRRRVEKSDWNPIRLIKTSNVMQFSDTYHQVSWYSADSYYQIVSAFCHDQCLIELWLTWMNNFNCNRSHPETPTFTGTHSGTIAGSTCIPAACRTACPVSIAVDFIAFGVCVCRCVSVWVCECVGVSVCDSARTQQRAASLPTGSRHFTLNIWLFIFLISLIWFS